MDFKTAGKFRGVNSEATKKHLLQCTAYAIMATERSHINTQKIVVLYCPDDEVQGIAVVKDRKDYEAHVEAIFSPRNRAQLY